MDSWRLLVVFIFLLKTVTAAETTTKRPNIIFILADDLGWNDVGFTGQSDLQTPNIDALAYHGRILMQHYTMATCTPSRTALLTGKYPIRTGMQGYPLMATEPRGLPLDQRLLPQYLKDLGYQTHLVGKWHLGHYMKKFTPTKRGFDSHFGHYNGFGSYYSHQIVFNNHTYHDLWRNGIPVNATDRYTTDLYTDEAVNIIQAAASGARKFTIRKPRAIEKYLQYNLFVHRNKIASRLERKDAPLFLLLSHMAPHAGNPGEHDLEYHEEDLARFSYIPDERRRKYAAMVWSLDKSVGRIVETLAGNAMLNNTIIVFSSDNGGATIQPYENGGSNHPLRGMKYMLLEGGVRTAALIWTPQLQLKPLGVSRQMFHITDWLPTLYAAAGTYLNGVRDRYYEDYKNATVPHKYNVSEVLRSKVSLNLDALHVGVMNKSEVYRIRSQATVVCDSTNSTKTLCDTAKSACLFDLHADPCERYNLLTTHPEIVTIMTSKLETYMQMLKPQVNVSLRSELVGPFDNDWAFWPEMSANVAMIRSVSFVSSIVMPLLLLISGNLLS
ncbi:hypothetical protein B566_EDAN009785 [Ephemera danica]|nr:hypothetical protein B566_EDAN009785 [Ephemera danica]